MEQLWSALEALLKVHAPLAWQALHPGAAPAQLAELTARGVAADLISSYRHHDGARVAGGVLGDLPRPRGAPWTRVARWLPVAEAIEETARIDHRIPTLRRALVVARVGRLQARDELEDEPQRLLLVADDGALFAAEELLRGYEPLACIPLELGWRAALESLARQLGEGALVGAREDGVDRLAPASRARKPPSPPRRPAASLVALLVDSGALATPPALDEAALDRLDAALRKRSPAARARAVRTIFDPGLDERTLTALLAEF